MSLLAFSNSLSLCSASLAATSALDSTERSSRMRDFALLMHVLIWLNFAVILSIQYLSDLGSTVHFCRIPVSRCISSEMTAWFQADEAGLLKSHCNFDGLGPRPVSSANTLASWLDTPLHLRKSSSWLILKAVLNRSLTCSWIGRTLVVDSR